jgi:hypothetical protein
MTTTPQPWKRKFRNQPVRTAEGYFASKKELADWQDLKLREKAGQIDKLQRQVKFALTHNGVHICNYIADAVFFENGKRVVFDSKGFETPEFKLKKKLMLALLNIHVVTA